MADLLVLELMNHLTDSSLIPSKYIQNRGLYIKKDPGSFMFINHQNTVENW